jgi:metal-responsive CopG/Arc/MetJ family transcriptional regulator
MSIITIRIDEEIVKETDNRAKNLHITRNEYIKRAIEKMNDIFRQNEKKQNLMKASMLVRKESMKVSAEFAEIEHDPKA